MNINKFNSEGYCDPTAFEALCNVEKAEKVYRPLVLQVVRGLRLTQRNDAEEDFLN